MIYQSASRQKTIYYVRMFAMLAVLAFYSVLASAFLYRLFPVWNYFIPGGLQDTRFLLWNDWWFRYAVDILHTNPFHTSLLYYPFGTSLILSDYPFWTNLITYLCRALQHGITDDRVRATSEFHSLLDSAWLLHLRIGSRCDGKSVAAYRHWWRAPTSR